MKTNLLTLALCFASFWIQAQKNPIALEYSIGAFRIPSNLDHQISERFDQLDQNRTYNVTIVGSADFLGSVDNNQVLSNKRVKFAEYHLLKKYSELRLIIKLDSKGEMHAENRPKTNQGVQEHRMVYIYIDEYRPNDDNSILVSSSDDNGNSIQGRTVATRSAVTAENLEDVPMAVSVAQSTPKAIKPISETAQIEIEKQKADIMNQIRNAGSEDSDDQTNGGTRNANTETATISAPPANDNSSTNANASGTLNISSNKELRKFEGEGTFAVGEKLLLSDLNFRPGSHYLRPSSIPTLRKLIDVLKSNPTLKIEVIGHICCHPDYSPHPDGFDREAGNNKLSFNRANNIKEYLEKNGVDGSRLKATGMGARERLVYPEETDADRIKNRRVEIKITSL